MHCMPCQIQFHSICTRSLKVTEKVSFNISSEASYIYILSGQKFIKNRIGVQSLMVMPSKLWRFEWSERGAIVVSFLVKMKKVTFKLPKKKIPANYFVKMKEDTSQNLP